MAIQIRLTIIIWRNYYIGLIQYINTITNTSLNSNKQIHPNQTPQAKHASKCGKTGKGLPPCSSKIKCIHLQCFALKFNIYCLFFKIYFFEL